MAMTAGLILPAGELAAAANLRDEDARYMAAALNLARRGLGRVAPNPAVGALVVKDGVLVGRGVTGHGGRPHAETIALQNAGSAAKGATLYVTLEPCSHHGHTPPCADAIIAAGISRVVSALNDPDARVSGEGHARLRAAGIDVRTDVLADAAMRLNLGHILRSTQKRPMLCLKLAETIDGYAAGAAGAPRLAITGEAANAHVHMMRALHDAILIGSGTAIADDPLLTVRLPGLDAVKPLRIVLDSMLALPAGSRLAVTASSHPTLVITTESASAQKTADLAAKGIEIMPVASGASGHVDLAAALAYLAARGLTRIFCEGGPHLAAALLRHGFADEIILLTGAAALGRPGLPAIDVADRAFLSDPKRYHLREEKMIGPDRLRHYERVV
ncbi:Riboflavin biosynthesis protein RibD [Methylovirgula sp. HY1]|nr:Riboflavin biosynthesis protein RibD [Methylovirgula sp. HY1]